MPHLTFIFPQALWLLLLLIPLLAIAFLGPRRLPPWELGLSLLLRAAILAGLVLALAGAQLVRPVDAVTTIFLLDGSDSVALSQRARAETFVQGALAAMPNDSQAALVVFGGRAVVERAPSGERTLGQVAGIPGGAATNIQEALQLGLSLAPAEGRQRLVLLSDGGENAGDAQAAARLAAARGVPVDVVTLSGAADGPDAAVGAVELPAAARAGQRLRMVVELESTTVADGRLVIQGPDGRALADQAVQLRPGTQRYEVILPEPQSGFNRYRIRLQVPDDARPENNTTEAFTFVSGQPRVLLVEGSPGAAAGLERALAAAQIEAVTVQPADMPGSLGSLGGYDAVALIDVPRRAVSDRAQSALAAYVHDLGRGLLMVGGPQAFGAGGWRETPVEQALPVTMDIPSQIRLPPVSIVVLIDVSGSMSQQENGRTKLSLAAEGAQRIAALIRDEDELTVVPFDEAPGAVVGPLPGSRRDEAIQALNTLQPGGGGITIHDGLEAAAQYARRSDRPIRHIITLSDGDDTEQQEGALELVRQLREDRVTVTSIAIGRGKDVEFLRQAAQAGGGRAFLTDRASNIPSILAEEAQAVIRPYIVEETFAPARGLPHPVLRGAETVPSLHGYVVTTPKQTAQVLLTAPRGEPVLAVWQYGLGRSIAWTSDFRGQWGKDWLNWEAFPRIGAQLFAWLLPSVETQNLTLRASAAGSSLVLSAQAQDALGRPRSGLDLDGRLLAADGSGIDVALREVAPGEYRGVVREARPGAYLAQITARTPEGQPFGTVTAGVLAPASAEYGSRGANPSLLQAIAHTTGGRVDPVPAGVFEATGVGRGIVQEVGVPLIWMALLLLPLDIALRRLRPGWGRLKVKPGAGDQGSGVGDRGPGGGSQGSGGGSQKPGRRGDPGDHPAPGRRGDPGDRPTAKDPLERLREAQERARRRARGEE
jgi:uncharacterized membrane protein